MSKILIFTTGIFCLFGNVNASLDNVIIPNIGWHNAKVKTSEKSELGDVISKKIENPKRKILNDCMAKKEDSCITKIKQSEQTKCDLTNIEKIIFKTEQKYGIPHGLLLGIALTESGKTDQNSKRFIPWPWTINANGKGYRLKSKQEAMQKVKELQDSGIFLIDVGCMQINLVHHSKAFRSLNEAFTPEKNIEYAAKFLVSLYEQKKSWEKATKCYHSANELLNNRYYCSVMRNYEKVLNMPKPPQHEDKVMHYLCKNDVKVSHYLCKNETKTPANVRKNKNIEVFDGSANSAETIDDAISKRLQALGKMMLARSSR